MEQRLPRGIALRGETCGGIGMLHRARQVRRSLQQNGLDVCIKAYDALAAKRFAFYRKRYRCRPAHLTSLKK